MKVRKVINLMDPKEWEEYEVISFFQNEEEEQMYWNHIPVIPEAKWVAEESEYLNAFIKTVNIFYFALGKERVMHVITPEERDFFYEIELTGEENLIVLPKGILLLYTAKTMIATLNGEKIFEIFNEVFSRTDTIIDISVSNGNAYIQYKEAHGKRRYKILKCELDFTDREYLKFSCI